MTRTAATSTITPERLARISCDAARVTLDAGTVEHRHLWQYEWCGGATLTTARFSVRGQPFVARRFWRADIGCAGIELYTVDPSTGSYDPEVGGATVGGSEDPIRGYYCDHQTGAAARRAKFLIVAGMLTDHDDGQPARDLDLDRSDR